jgi:hypothetical protein
MTWKRLGALALAVAVSAPALGEDLVYFQNGQAMRVDKTRREGKWLYLTLAAEQEMAVLARQVKKVEPAPILPGGAHSGSVAANLVQSGGGGGGYVPAAPIAESYDATEMGEEPQVAQPTPDQLQQQQIQQQMQQAAQGADLVPRNPNIRRAGRPRR